MSTPLHTGRDTRTLHRVSALVDEGLVESTRRDDAIGVVDRVLGGQSTQAGPLKRRLAELAGYVGGAFVISAAAIFLTAQWGSLGSGQRVLLSAGVAVLLAVAGGSIGAATGAGFSAIRSGQEPVRRRLTGALLTGAAGSAAGAVGVLFDWQYPDTDTGAALTGFAVLTVLSLVGYLVAPTVVGQLGVATGAMTSVALVVEQSHGQGIAMGLGTIGLGLVWIVAAERGLWREIASARVIGCVLAVVGAQIPVWDLGDQRWVGYLALALVAAAAFATYVARPAWPYLAAGVIAVTLVIPEALIDWTDNALGPAGALLVAGLTLLTASLLGLRLRKELTEKPAG